MYMYVKSTGVLNVGQVSYKQQIPKGTRDAHQGNEKLVA
jgi:hypothetical protein